MLVTTVIIFSTPLQPNARLIHVVDVPGHPRLRNVFDSQVNLARGIIFLVDSVDFMKSKKTDAAE